MQLQAYAWANDASRPRGITTRLREPAADVGETSFLGLHLHVEHGSVQCQLLCH